MDNQLRPELESVKSRSEKLSEDLSGEIEILSEQVNSIRTDLTSSVSVNRNQTRILTRLGDKANDLAEEFTKQADQFSQLLNTVSFPDFWLQILALNLDPRILDNILT